MCFLGRKFPKNRSLKISYTFQWKFLKFLISKIFGFFWSHFFLIFIQFPMVIFDIFDLDFFKLLYLFSFSKKSMIFFWNSNVILYEFSDTIYGNQEHDKKVSRVGDAYWAPLLISRPAAPQQSTGWGAATQMMSLVDAPSGLFVVFVSTAWHENSIGSGEQNNLQVINILSKSIVQ